MATDLDAGATRVHPGRGQGRRLPVLPDRVDGRRLRLVVARGSLVYAVLNLYPYNSGHLMVVPTVTSRRTSS